MQTGLFAGKCRKVPKLSCFCRGYFRQIWGLSENPKKKEGRRFECVDGMNAEMICM